MNHLELKAVFVALKEFKDIVSNNIVLVATGNTTVVAYINKGGGDEVGPSVCPLHPLKHALQIFTEYRRIKRRVGRSLKRTHCKGNLVPSRKQIAHKSFGTKGGLSGPKRVPRPLFKQHSTGSHRQQNSGCLYQQVGGMKSGSLCALLWRILSWCTRKQVTLSARHIPGWLNVIADKLSRLGQTIQTEWSLHPEVFQAICSRWHQPQVDLFATRFNNKLPQFVTPVPDPQAWAVDALSPGKIWTHMPSHQQPSWAK